MAEKIARVYSCATFEGVKAGGMQKEMYTQISELFKVLAETPELMKVLKHPDIAKEEKQELVVKVFKGKLMDDLYGLMMCLIEKERISYLEEILEELVALYKEDQGIGVVKVITAKPLKNDQRIALEKKLLADTGYKTLEVSTEVDESLIGGMIVQIGDRRVDGSVASRLNNMTRQLKLLQIK